MVNPFFSANVSSVNASEEECVGYISRLHIVKKRFSDLQQTFFKISCDVSLSSILWKWKWLIFLANREFSNHEYSNREYSNSEYSNCEYFGLARLPYNDQSDETGILSNVTIMEKNMVLSLSFTLNAAAHRALSCVIIIQRT